MDKKKEYSVIIRTPYKSRETSINVTTKVLWKPKTIHIVVGNGSKNRPSKRHSPSFVQKLPFSGAKARVNLLDHMVEAVLFNTTLKNGHTQVSPIIICKDDIKNIMKGFLNAPRDAWGTKSSLLPLIHL